METKGQVIERKFHKRDFSPAFSRYVLLSGEQTLGMKISEVRCYPKFSIETLLKLHFIEAICSVPHWNWLALIMLLWCAPGDSEVSISRCYRNRLRCSQTSCKKLISLIIILIVYKITFSKCFC